MSTSKKTDTVTRPRSLADDLRQRSDEQLEVLFAARPDLLHPVPTDLGQLAVRATTSPSVSAALDALNHIELSVCEVLAALPDPAARIEVHEGLKGALGYAPAAIDSAIDRLQSSALLWGDDEELHLVRVARESFGAYPCGLAASFADSRRKVREYANKKTLAEKTLARMQVLLLESHSQHNHKLQLLQLLLHTIGFYPLFVLVHLQLLHQHLILLLLFPF
jgi:hypothetical protein